MLIKKKIQIGLINFYKPSNYDILVEIREKTVTVWTGKGYHIYKKSGYIRRIQQMCVKARPPKRYLAIWP